MLHIATGIKKIIAIGIKYVQFLVSSRPSLVTKTATLAVAQLGSADLGYIPLILGQGSVMGGYAGGIITICASVLSEILSKKCFIFNHYFFSV